MRGQLLLFVFGLIFVSSSAFAQKSVTGKVSNVSGTGIGGYQYKRKEIKRLQAHLEPSVFQ